MQPSNFEEVLQQLIAKDPRYLREAYFFVRESLDYTQKRAAQSKKSEPRHVTGMELLEGAREYILALYGPMAKSVLNEWGIRSCEDIGEIVFNLVAQGVLSKTDKDSPDDFKGGYNFDDAFCKPFRPKAREELNATPPLKGRQP